jgi:DNA-binding XRE family transcriptional regulator
VRQCKKPTLGQAHLVFSETRANAQKTKRACPFPPLTKKSSFHQKFIYLHLMLINMNKKAINRLKVVLVEQGKTNKWLAEKLDKNETTISRWCTNEVQPSLETLIQISELLHIDVKELLISNKEHN